MRATACLRLPGPRGCGLSHPRRAPRCLGRPVGLGALMGMLPGKRAPGLEYRTGHSVELGGGVVPPAQSTSSTRLRG